MPYNLDTLPHRGEQGWHSTTKDDLEISIWVEPTITGHAGNPPYSGLVQLINRGNYDMSQVIYHLVIDDSSRPWNPYFCDPHGHILNSLKPRILEEHVGKLKAGRSYWNWFYYELISTGLQPQPGDNFLKFEMDTSFKIEFSDVAPLDVREIVN